MAYWKWWPLLQFSLHLIKAACSSRNPSWADTLQGRFTLQNMPTKSMFWSNEALCECRRRLGSLVRNKLVDWRLRERDVYQAIWLTPRTVPEDRPNASMKRWSFLRSQNISDNVSQVTAWISTMLSAARKGIQRSTHNWQPLCNRSSTMLTQLNMPGSDVLLFHKEGSGQCTRHS